MSDWVWEVDAGARYTYCSEKVKDVLGYTAEEMIGKTPFDLVIPDETDSVGAEFAELVGERRTFRNMENWIRTKDGRSVCMSTSGVPILDDAGELLGYRGVDSDITERKNAEDVLQKEKDMAQHYLDIAGVMFLVIGADRKVSLINKKGYEILGYEEEEEIAGKDWFDNFVPERLRDEVARVFGSLIAGEIEQVEYHENPVLTKHGEEKIVAWHNTILRDEQGRIYATMASGEDITERKAAEKAVSESEEKLRMITASANDAILMMDHKGKISYWNKAATRIFGYTEEEVIGKDLHALLAPERFHAAFSKGFEGFKETGQGGAIGKTVELVAFGKDGKEFPVELSLSAVKLEGRWNAIGLEGRCVHRRREVQGQMEREETGHRSVVPHRSDVRRLCCNAVRGWSQGGYDTCKRQSQKQLQ